MNPTDPQPTPAGGTRLVVIALGLALAAVVVVNLYISHVKAQVAADAFTLYRLTRAVGPGDTFKADYVEAVKAPLSFQTSFQGFVRDDALANFAGDPVLRNARQGDFLMNQVFTPPTGGDDYRQPRIGKRFVKLTINNRAVPGNLQPEMVVDIVAPFAGDRGEPKPLAVMEEVRIIAVGSRTADFDDDETRRPRPIGSFHNITIEVTPEEAMKFSLIEKIAVGDFELLLRNAGDDGHPAIPGGGINPKVLELLEKPRRTVTAPEED